MLLFTTGDLLELTDINPKTFDSWIANYSIEPLAGGNGTGHHRQWSIMQAVGWVIAVELINSERGCAPQYAGEVIKAFGNVDEAWLQKRQSNGRGRHLVRVHQGKPLLQTGPPDYEWPDVAAAYERMKKYAARRNKRAAKR